MSLAVGKIMGEKNENCKSSVEAQLVEELTNFQCLRVQIQPLMVPSKNKKKHMGSFALVWII
jgi:hypothetical protein